MCTFVVTGQTLDHKKKQFLCFCLGVGVHPPPLSSYPKSDSHVFPPIWGTRCTHTHEMDLVRCCGCHMGLVLPHEEACTTDDAYCCSVCTFQFQTTVFDERVFDAEVLRHFAASHPEYARQNAFTLSGWKRTSRSTSGSKNQVQKKLRFAEGIERDNDVGRLFFLFVFLGTKSPSSSEFGKSSFFNPRLAYFAGGL
jgi:hypothetical protein